MEGREFRFSVAVRYWLTRGVASRLDGRRAAAVNHYWRSGTLRHLHAMWVVGSRLRVAVAWLSRRSC